MKKRILITLMLILLILCFMTVTGCTTDKTYNTRFKMERTNDIADFRIYYDTYTCVEYAAIDRAGLAPLFNADGTLQQNEECLRGQE